MRVMEPTDLLRHEHELILSALRTLDTLARRVADGERPRRNFDRLFDFFDHFADGCHHVKEEQLLFPALSEAGLPANDAPLLGLMREHEAGRRLLAHIRATVDDLGDKDRRRAFVEAVGAYVHLLAQHIEKENRILFRVAEELLDVDVRSSIGERFAVCHGERATEQRDRWSQIVRRIAHEARHG
jgi:hemerythrin-like domain-containing protein